MRNVRAANAFAALILIDCRDVKQLPLANENLTIPKDTILGPFILTILLLLLMNSRVRVW